MLGSPGGVYLCWAISVFRITAVSPGESQVGLEKAGLCFLLSFSLWLLSARGVAASLLGAGFMLPF